jgi:hypothetical protein
MLVGYQSGTFHGCSFARSPHYKNASFLLITLEGSLSLGALCVKVTDYLPLTVNTSTPAV